jgi:hypothetical protein
MTGETLIFQRRSYTQAADGAVTLGNAAEEVKPVTRFEPVTPTAAAGHGPSGVQAGQPARKDANVKTKKERVLALIASGKTCFTNADASVLEQLPEERIKALEDHAAQEEAKVEEKPKADPEVKVEAKVDPAEEEEKFLKAHPDLQRIVTQHKAAEANRKTELLKALAATKQTVYSEAELKAMSLEDLEKLNRLAGGQANTIDQSGRGLPRAAAAEETAPPPPSMDAKIKALRANEKN